MTAFLAIFDKLSINNSHKQRDTAKKIITVQKTLTSFLYIEPYDIN